MPPPPASEDASATSPAAPKMAPQTAIDRVAGMFPFPKYMVARHDIGNAYLNIASTVSRHLPPGARILDFGSGPCDKSAVLSLMGYKCTAWDDLQDDWHKRPGIRDKILAFARDAGVEFLLAERGTWPFQAESFDMVMIHDVIEHFHDSPRELLNSLLQLCRPGGYLFITVPNAANIRKRLHLLAGKTNYPRFDLYYWYPGSWRGHVREYVRDDLRELSVFLGAEVAELRGCDHMLGKVPRILQRPYLVSTACFDSLKDSWTLLLRRPPDWQPSNSLPQKELDAILGRTTTFEY